MEILVQAKPELALAIAILGDVHLDHPRVPTRFIIDRLNEILTDEYLKRLDVLVINGDLFERRVMFDSESAYQSVRWITNLLRRCGKYDVTLHVLEGTPSHDHTQAKWFGEMANLCGIDVDYYYHNALEITPLYKDSGLTALWIPDEINTSAAITQTQVGQLLTTQALDSVSYTFVHGMFIYQEPVVSKASHDEAFYEGITDYLIVTNHIHKPTSSGKIRAPGSTVRLSHGEEETKGHLYIEHSKVIKDYFIETENNSRFDTLDMQGQDMAYVRNVLNIRESEGGVQYIRLKLKRTDPVLASIPELRKHYPFLNLTTKVIDDDIPEQITGKLIDKPILVSIRPETLPVLILERMKEYETTVVDAAKKLLAEPVA